MGSFLKQLFIYIALVIVLFIAATFVPQAAPAGWIRQAIGVSIWLAALIIGLRAIGWGATVYAEEIAPRTTSDLDSPFLVRTVRNLVMVLFLFVIVGGIATTVNDEFNPSFFAGGVGFAVSLGLAPVVGAYILDVRRAAIIDKAIHEGDVVRVGDLIGLVKGQDAYFLELLQIPGMRDIRIEHSNVFGQFEVLERFEEVNHDVNAIGAVVEGDAESGFGYSYTDDAGVTQKVTVPHTHGIAGQAIKLFDKSLGYHRVIGDPLLTLDLDADGSIAAENPQALLDAMQQWYTEFPDTIFDKSFVPEMHNHIYIDKSSVNGGAAVPARMMVRVRSYQLLNEEAYRIGHTILAMKAYAGGWGYGTTSNITIGNAKEFRE